MKKWDIKNNFKFQISNFKLDKFTKILLENRGLKTKKEIDAFLNPRLENVTVDSVDIDKKQLAKVLKRIEKSIKDKEQIVVFGDYDVDGICGTAILWETLHNLGARVMPYIPHRVDEGYGLSKKGISNVKSEMPDVKLIITVDNGIVASEAVEYAKKKGIDVIITDHHVPSKKLPKAYAIVHTTKLCGTGVAYLLSKVLRHIPRNEDDEHLELVALATIADLVPLREANRVLTKYGLSALAKTKRLGLLELFKEAALDASVIGVYHVGHIIAPRLNAMGRMEYAMGSLRLLCTKSSDRAVKLAWKLGQTNRERQMLTKDSFLQA
ncbi:MAG: DHH family phosphoesterase, partial [Candidatus Levybacteria bacterium]|nr:DHH family phosphoesterase [Candidatus Levybacteria bacterium]